MTKERPLPHSLLPDFFHFLARSKTVMSGMDRMAVQARSLCTAAFRAFTSCSRFSFQKASSNFSKGCFVYRKLLKSCSKKQKLTLCMHCSNMKYVQQK